MLQPFDSQDHDNFPPAELDNYAKQMRDKQTNFLAFNKTMPKYMAVEYAKAQSTDWAAQLDDTFAKKGVWDMRYADVANPYAAGVDYNRDMGGPDIFKIKPDSAKIGTVSSENMAGQKRFMGLPVTNEKAEAADYIKDTVGESSRYDTVKPMAYTENAYHDYGYKVYGLEKPEEDSSAALAMFMRQSAKEKETAAFTHDVDFCPPGNTWVNGECIPIENNTKPICPYGWRLNGEGRCQLMPNKEFQEGTSSAPSSAPKKGGINTDMKRAKATIGQAGRDTEGAAKNIGEGAEDLAKKSWGAVRAGASGAYRDVSRGVGRTVAGIKTSGKDVIGGSEDLVKHEGSVMAHDIYKATHREKMVAVEDTLREHSTGIATDGETPVYTFFFQDWTPAQSLASFVLIAFLIFLVVFMVRYSIKSPMRQQVEYEKNRVIFKQNKQK